MASSRPNPALHAAFESEDSNPERALVRRIVSSQCFEKSARMRDFLTYVCQRALDEQQSDIPEHDVGCGVFGRPADYDTNQDNIVRVNASQLRKRLETYFASEGAAEPIVLELPKGQYAPVFRPRRAPEASSAGNLPGPPARRRLVWSLAALSLILAAACLALLAALLSRRPPGDPLESPRLNALWSGLLKQGQTTDIVLADSSLGLTEDLIEKIIPLSDYIHPDIWRQAGELAARPDAQLAARLVAKRRHTDMASVAAARNILMLAGSRQGRINLCFARDFNLRQMKTENVILLGSRRTNPWVELVENRMHFRFGFDPATRQGYFENRQPLPGEASTYANDAATSYCLITFLPNLTRNGNILVVSGTDVEGTEVGAEFLTSEAGVASLTQRVAANRTRQFPYFEALLKSPRVGHATPGWEIVACRRGE